MNARVTKATKNRQDISRRAREAIEPRAQEAKILDVSVGFLWRKVCARMKLTNIVFLPRCWRPLPDSTADDSSEHKHASDIKEFPAQVRIRKHEQFWESNLQMMLTTAKTSNNFMPKKTLAGRGGLAPRQATVHCIVTHACEGLTTKRVMSVELVWRRPADRATRVPAQTWARKTGETRSPWRPKRRERSAARVSTVGGARAG